MSSDEEFEDFDENINDISDEEFDILCDYSSGYNTIQHCNNNSSVLTSSNCPTISEKTPFKSTPAPWSNVKFSILPTPMVIPETPYKSPKEKFRRIFKRKTDILTKTSLPISPATKPISVMQLLKTKFASPNFNCLKSSENIKSISLDLPDEDKELIKSIIEEQEKKLINIEIEKNIQSGQEEEPEQEYFVEDICKNTQSKSIEALKEQQSREAELEKIKREKRIKKNIQRSINKEKQAADLLEKINKKLKGGDNKYNSSLQNKNMEFSKPTENNSKSEALQTTRREPYRPTDGRRSVDRSQGQIGTQQGLSTTPYCPIEYTPNQHQHKQRPPRIYPDPSKKTETVGNIKCTRFCDFWAKTGHCTRSSCNFAHSLEEYNPNICKFDNKCRYQSTCQFKHSSETPEQMVKRLNIRLYGQITVMGYPSSGSVDIPGGTLSLRLSDLGDSVPSSPQTPFGRAPNGGERGREAILGGTTSLRLSEAILGGTTSLRLSEAIPAPSGRVPRARRDTRRDYVPPTERLPSVERSDTRGEEPSSQIPITSTLLPKAESKYEPTSVPENISVDIKRGKDPINENIVSRQSSSYKIIRKLQPLDVKCPKGDKGELGNPGDTLRDVVSQSPMVDFEVNKVYKIPRETVLSVVENAVKNGHKNITIHIIN